MKRTAIIAMAGLVASAGIVVVEGVPASASMTKNLIVNGGAEQGTGSGDGHVVPGPIGRTRPGRPSLPSSTERLAVVSLLRRRLASFVNAIKGGHVTARLTGWLGGSGTRTDQAFVEVDFKNKMGFLVGSSMVLPASQSQYEAEKPSS